MEILLNGKTAYFEGETLLDLIVDELLLNPEKILIAYKNGEPVGAENYKNVKVEERDMIEIFVQRKQSC